MTQQHLGNHREWQHVGDYHICNRDEFPQLEQNAEVKYERLSAPATHFDEPIGTDGERSSSLLLHSLEIMVEKETSNVQVQWAQEAEDTMSHAVCLSGWLCDAPPVLLK